MGITIRTTSRKATARPIDMGAVGFLQLRKKVAELTGDPWASHYATLCNSIGYALPEGKRAQFYADFDNKTKELLRKNMVPTKIVDFCMQSDVQGRIHYGACAAILKAAGDYDDNVSYGYAGRKDCAKWRDFRAILEDCVRCKCDMVWE